LRLIDCPRRNNICHKINSLAAAGFVFIVVGIGTG
jgi:hypothetical protein